MYDCVKYSNVSDMSICYEVITVYWQHWTCGYVFNIGFQSQM